VRGELFEVITDKRIYVELYYYRKKKRNSYLIVVAEESVDLVDAVKFARYCYCSREGRKMPKLINF
jgi:hypothetical protein